MPNHWKLKQRRKLSHLWTQIISCPTKALRNYLFKSNFVKQLPFVLQTTGCAIQLQKQPAVRSRRVRLNVSGLVFSATKETSDKWDLEIHSKRQVHRHNAPIAIVCYFKWIIETNYLYMTFAASLVFFNNSHYGFLDLPQQAIHAVNLV